MANYETKHRTGRDDWGTPQWVYDQLNQEFNFTLDAAASRENAKCSNYYDEGHDGLTQKWTGRVYCNPPYGSQTKKWVAKAQEEVRSGNCDVAVLLLPVRTCAKWFHNSVAGQAELRFIEGRLTFEGADQGAMFPSMIAIYRPPSTWDQIRGYKPQTKYKTMKQEETEHGQHHAVGANNAINRSPRQKTSD